MSLISKIKINSSRFASLFLLGDGLGQKLKAIGIFLMIYMASKVTKQPKKIFVCRISFRSKKLNIHVRDYSDVILMLEIFSEEAYRPLKNIDPSAIGRIFDLGGNIGLSALYLGVIFPAADILVFEPNVNIIELLKMNCAQNGRIKVVNKMISGQNGKASFYPGQSSLGSSIHQRAGFEREVKVESLMLDQAIESFGAPDLIKFDIEGAEFAAFQPSQKLGQVKYLIGETHFDLLKESKDQFYQIFNQSGFKVEEYQKLSATRDLIFIHR